MTVKSLAPIRAKLQFHQPAKAVSYPDPIPGYIAHGSINMLAGASGVGKSGFLAEWAARLRDGKTICGKPTHPPTSLGMISGDRQGSDHRKWLDEVGYPDMPHYALRDDDDFDWEQSLKTRAAAQTTMKRALTILGAQPGGLVFLDPIALFIPGNMSDYKNCAIGIAMLAKVFKEFDISVIAIAHTGKQKNDPNAAYTRPQDRILGSTALLGFSDTPMYFVELDGGHESEREFGWIPHHRAPERHLFRRNDKGLFIPYMDKVENENSQKVLDAIPATTDGISTGELCDQLLETYGMSQSTVYRHLRVLEGGGYVTTPRGKAIRCSSRLAEKAKGEEKAEV